jgi:hypothetical protein
LDLRQDLVDVGHDILVLDQDGLVGAVAQRDVQHLTTRHAADGPSGAFQRKCAYRALLGEVDLLAAEHLHAQDRASTDADQLVELTLPIQEARSISLNSSLNAFMVSSVITFLL